MLSFGGKATLINSVLQSIPIYTLSAIVPPKCVITELHKIFTNFFWNNKETGRSKHWTTWQNVCLPRGECGLGFRPLVDVSKAMFTKLWWKFRTCNSVWANFMWNKYCKKALPTLVQWKGRCQVWKMMLDNRDILEKNMWWEPRGGTTNIWYENWTKLGPLCHEADCIIRPEMESINELMNEEGWDLDKIQQVLPKRIVNHVQQQVSNVMASTLSDRPWWLLESLRLIQLGNY